MENKIKKNLSLILEINDEERLKELLSLSMEIKDLLLNSKVSNKEAGVVLSSAMMLVENEPILGKQVNFGKFIECLEKQSKVYCCTQ